ncbi:hypothetical protein D1007_29473 [Hordeum vulgare]|nr:hypothetical protein D1007_29473 [Hordeum vulgare]
MQAGLCSFLRSTETYMPELTRAGISQPQLMNHPLALHHSGPLQQRSRRAQDAMDGSQAEIQPAHAPVMQQMHGPPPLPVAATHCCSNDSHRTALLLAGTNLIVVVALLYLVFCQQSS